MRNPCQDETLLSAFLDGELSETEGQGVRRHIADCDACRQLLADLTAADGLVRRLDTLEPSAEFDRTFWRKVKDQQERQKEHWWRQWLTPGWRPALASALACSLAVGVFILTGPEKGISPEDRFMAEHVEFLTDYDLIEHLEILENWEAMEKMEELS